MRFITPTTIAIFRGQKLIALHSRNYGRNQDIENPDHLSRLLEERKRAEDAALLARFLALSPKAETYYGALRQRELHAMGHVRRILLLMEHRRIQFFYSPGRSSVTRDQKFY